MNQNNKPLLILAWGFSVGLALTGLGFLLQYTLPALGAMMGIAEAIANGEHISQDSWVLPLGAIGLALAGGSAAVILLVKVVKEAEKNLYEWTLPILAIISGFVFDTCKEVYQINYSGQNDFLMRLGYGISVTALFLFGGILWKQKKMQFRWIDSKMISAAIFMIAPLLIYFKYCEHTRKSIWNGYLDLPAHILGAIGILLMFSLLVGFLSWVFKEEEPLN